MLKYVDLQNLLKCRGINHRFKNIISFESAFFKDILKSNHISVNPKHLSEYFKQNNFWNLYQYRISCFFYSNTFDLIDISIHNNPYTQLAFLVSDEHPVSNLVCFFLSIYFAFSFMTHKVWKE